MKLFFCILIFPQLLSCFSPEDKIEVQSNINSNLESDFQDVTISLIDIYIDTLYLIKCDSLIIGNFYEQTSEGGEIKRCYSHGELVKVTITQFGNIQIKSENYILENSKLKFYTLEENYYNQPLSIEGSVQDSSYSESYVLSGDTIIESISSLGNQVKLNGKQIKERYLYFMNIEVE